jgi:hypothetical protein
MRWAGEISGFYQETLTVLLRLRGQNRTIQDQHVCIDAQRFAALISIFGCPQAHLWCLASVRPKRAEIKKKKQEKHHEKFNFQDHRNCFHAVRIRPGVRRSMASNGRRPE